jgi:hypothetical protein
LARQLARRRHRERIAGALVVGLGVVVLVVALLALREPNGHVAAVQSASAGASNVAEHSPSRPTKRPAKTHRAVPARTDSGRAVHDVPLIVLNNTSTPGLAEQAARRFQAGGWTVTSLGNLVNDIKSTCAYYDAADPRALAAAEALRAQYPTIKRVEPKFAGLPSGPVVVVLTGDYSPA